MEVVPEGGNRLRVYGSTCAEVGETAFRHGTVVHRLAARWEAWGPERTSPTRPGPPVMTRGPGPVTRNVPPADRRLPPRRTGALGRRRTGAPSRGHPAALHGGST
ncbi:ABC transporter [Streptomyces viridosporus ATCC 14672]|uniref:ABC transporter n=1 Tax=Streptomyces viridosporus (strain ATCC 14672 / DSM 40746 / JCM 4963 / KCTC 9882 / NRRL B-12104 / FH 1290) TaxID=566461 RepID=D5ZSY2_STRV1|nr:ABC transporter [Streptomyces viridosporus ATCC 14672]